MNEVVALDPIALSNIRKLGGRTLLMKMIDLFVESAPLRLEALADALSARDLEALVAAAHSLRSSSGNFGASPLSGLAGQIEELARDGRGDEIPPLADWIDTVLKSTIEALLVERAAPDV